MKLIVEKGGSPTIKIVNGKVIVKGDVEIDNRLTRELYIGLADFDIIDGVVLLKFFGEDIVRAFQKGNHVVVVTQGSDRQEFAEMTRFFEKRGYSSVAWEANVD